MLNLVPTMINKGWVLVRVRNVTPEKANYIGVTQERELNMMLFFVTINGILSYLGSGVEMFLYLQIT